MPLSKGQPYDPLSRLWEHCFKYKHGFKTFRHMSARTKEANTPSSRAKRLSGVSYSKIFPRFITITRSAVRIVWTRCCEWEKNKCIRYKFQGTSQSNGKCIFHCLYKGNSLSWAQPFFFLCKVWFIYILLNTSQYDWILYRLY